MKKIYGVIGIIGMTALSACSSSSGSAARTTGGTVPMVTTKGAGSGALTIAEINQTNDSYALFASAVGNTISAPTTAPTGKATLTGYTVISTSIATGSVHGVFGNLTVEADFDAGTVTTSGANYVEIGLDTEDNIVADSTYGISGGTLSGSGTINGTTMTSTLDGTLTATTGDITVDADMTGSFIDNGGTLTVYGSGSGTYAQGGVISNIKNSAFFVSE